MADGSVAFQRDFIAAQEHHAMELLSAQDKIVLVHIGGPANTPYAGGVFEVRFAFPTSYPYGQPEAVFVIKIWNEQVDPSSGVIQMPFETSIVEAIEYVKKAMRERVGESPPLFEETAKFWTQVHAGDDSERNPLFLETLEKVEGMGFPQHLAMVALGLYGWDVDAAIEYCLEGDQ